MHKRGGSGTARGFVFGLLDCTEKKIGLEIPQDTGPFPVSWAHVHDVRILVNLELVTTTVGNPPRGDFFRLGCGGGNINSAQSSKDEIQ
jgi:hypothetical protein